MVENFPLAITTKFTKESRNSGEGPRSRVNVQGQVQAIETQFDYQHYFLIGKICVATTKMIKEALVTLKERTGSSQYAIAKFIEENQKHLPANFKKVLLTQLKKLVAAGKLVKVKASYKLPSAKAPAAAAAPAKKKPVSKPKTAAKPKTVKKLTPAKKKTVAKPKAVAKPSKAVKAPVKAAKVAKKATPSKKAPKKAVVKSLKPKGAIVKKASGAKKVKK